MSINDYSNAWITRRGVERGIEIVSEATRRIPEAVRAQRPEIPWARISGIGNVLRHEYRRIADALIFEIVRRDLPPLKAAILAIEASLDEPEE